MFHFNRDIKVAFVLQGAECDRSLVRCSPQVAVSAENAYGGSRPRRA
ncbi:MAG: hypothetical protein AAFQ14_02150 [Cyanobacteria bacterium J06621_12]